ncbi:MAG: hypothetical protein V3V33_06510 [Candidatus Lokiarchaeia archaeon]
MKRSLKLGLRLGLFIVLVLLVNLSTFTTGGSVSISDFVIYNLFAISIFCYIYIIAVIGIFLVSSFRSLWFHYKFKGSSKYQRVQITATLSASLAIFITIFIGILIFVYNLLLLAVNEYEQFLGLTQDQGLLSEYKELHQATIDAFNRDKITSDLALQALRSIRRQALLNLQAHKERYRMYFLGNYP